MEGRWGTDKARPYPLPFSGCLCFCPPPEAPAPFLPPSRLPSSHVESCLRYDAMRGEDKRHRLGEGSCPGLFTHAERAMPFSFRENACHTHRQRQ